MSHCPECYAEIDFEDHESGCIYADDDSVFDSVSDSGSDSADCDLDRVD